jgi:hypothetical protein
VNELAEREFQRDMLVGAERLRRELSYNPQRFNQMIGNYGGVGAVKRLLQGNDVSDGFTTLWAAARLELSVEAFVLLPWYQYLFTEEERTIARRRLEQVEFDVDGYLVSADQTTPAWFEQATGSGNGAQ